MSEKVVEVDYLARVEGETAININIKGKEPQELKLNIFEPPRFFEGFLVGRKYYEVPDIVARICGICPVSHMTTALRAIEKAIGISPSEQTRILRRLMALSQIVSSHLIHLYMLAMPDYYGYPGAQEMLPEFADELSRLMRMKKVMNELTAVVGGRALHPVSAVVNGFTDLPSPQALNKLHQDLEKIEADAVKTVRMVSEFPFPNFFRKTEYVALKQANCYAIMEGNIVSSEGLDISEEDYEKHFEEEEASYSMAKRAKVKDRGPLMVGALARLHLKFDQLPPSVRRLAQEVGFRIPDYNSFHNNIAQSLEVVYGIQECRRILENLKLSPNENSYQVRAGEGGAFSEAPRGLLYHRYAINARGVIEKANIVTPTVHNFANIEEDMRHLVRQNSDLPERKIALLCEMLVRAYDPCFSCSVH
ncbi:MAG: Ni/Fe hydrogenase subunit alpha [bacterium]